MRYILTVSAAVAALAFTAPAFAAGESIHSGGGGCGFSAARLARLMTPPPAEPAKATTVQVDQVLALPQIAALLPAQPKPAAQR
ncbi:MAG: hypothetical protein ACTSX7_02100 [Alphaproteobacteria bacterium]